MSTAQLYMGAVAPEAFVLEVTTGDSGVDLTTVTAASFSVLKPTGTEVSWTAATSGATASALTLTYALPGGSSAIDVEGLWKVYALLTVPGGTVRTSTVSLHVLGEYG